MMTLFNRFLLRKFRRKEHTANRAYDATQVVRWTWRRGVTGPTSHRFNFTMIASWGVEVNLTLFGRTWRTYDNRFFKSLFGLLEAAHE